MLEYLMNPDPQTAYAILGILTVATFAGMKCWWAGSAKRRQLMADQAAADRRALSARFRAQLREGL